MNFIFLALIHNRYKRFLLTKVIDKYSDINLSFAVLKTMQNWKLYKNTS